MIYMPVKVQDLEQLVVEASVLCRHLSIRSRRALESGDVQAYSHLIALQRRATERWQRRQGGAVARRLM